MQCSQRLASKREPLQSSTRGTPSGHSNHYDEMTVAKVP
jgi:hypothetical protein